MSKSNDQKLRDFIKSNKDYRLKVAKANGFETAEQYKEYLVALVNENTFSVNEPSTEEKPTIHIVDILDASGSMSGGKYNNSKQGIERGIEDLKNDTTINYTYSLVEFVEKGNIKTHQLLESFPSSIKFTGAHGGDTPLYETVFNTLTQLKDRVKAEDKVLVKIYTDGGNNTGTTFIRPSKELIDDLNSKNFTITFVATDLDLNIIIRDLNIDRSNTLAVTNDALGFQSAFATSLSATRSYASKVLKKVDVKKGFYKDLVNK